MIELGRRTGLILEPLHTGRIARVLGSKDFEGDNSIEPEIIRSEHSAHAAASDPVENLIRAQLEPGDIQGGTGILNPQTAGEESVPPVAGCRSGAGFSGLWCIRTHRGERAQKRKGGSGRTRVRS